MFCCIGPHQCPSLIVLSVIAISIVGNWYAITHYPFSRDAGLAGALITIWQEIELAYSLAAVTISSSKAFADAFATGFGWGDTFREVATQYVMESQLSNERSGNQSRNLNNRPRSGVMNGTNTSGSGSRHGYRRDAKDAYQVTSYSGGSVTNSDGDIELSSEKGTNQAPNYHQNEYNYGQTQTDNSNDTLTKGRGSWRRKDLINAQSEYQDPLADEQQDVPMKLRPERKLRSTAVITSQPHALHPSFKRANAEGNFDNSTDEWGGIMRHQDYSVKIDEMPLTAKEYRHE